MESKRKFKRFGLPFGVKFRPTYGAIEYSSGVSMNLSCEGLGLDAHDFRFFVYENLELIFEAPGSGDPVSLVGDVLWKRQTGRRCLAGIKFKMKNESIQKETIAKIFSSSNISIDNMFSDDTDYMIREKTERPPAAGSAGFSGLPNKLGFIKEYYEKGTKCKVTFRLPREMADNIKNVTIVGDFNNWDTSESPMTALGNGDFVITMDLESKAEYRFRYFLDGHRWENDWYADRFVPNGLGSKDSVVIV